MTPNYKTFVFDNLELDKAYARTTHLAIAAHQDDIEFMAYHGIKECFGSKDKWFSAIVVTNGAGSPRAGIYADCSDNDMMEIRALEQKKAAFVGEYSTLSSLNYPSSVAKSKDGNAIVDDLVEIIRKAKPEVVYTHNLADKHDAHVGVVVKVIKALRKLDKSERPKVVYGCEVWRALDWLTDDEKISLDVGDRQNLATSIMGVFDSQISGGKRYDSAVIGRRMANATFGQSHSVDTAEQLTLAMDLTPLMEDPSLDMYEYVKGYIDRMALDIKDRMTKVL